ncbi:hypothetical protein B0J17DRAFT_235730 [Rhizoctonia solani]|nr:hypothetical protein B0J17DRAFT_235730 [Rhizoctonia solani]
MHFAGKTRISRETLAGMSIPADGPIGSQPFVDWTQTILRLSNPISGYRLPRIDLLQRYLNSILFQYCT